MTDHTCPDCGAAALTSISGGSIVLSCNQCTWAVATTNYQRPEWDRNTYRVFLTTTSGSLPRAAGRVAAELGISGKEALQALRDGQPLAPAFTAKDVVRLDSLLTPRGFTVSTEPSFPWALADGS